MKSLEAFLNWHNNVKSDIHNVLTLLSQKLDSEPEGLIHDLMIIEAWNGRMLELFSQANGWMDIAKLEALPPREEGTELSRKLAIDSKVSSVKVVRDTLEGICDSIKQRLILGESIIRYHSLFPDRKNKTQSDPF